MTYEQKIVALRDLEARGIVREECPTPYYWRFSVIVEHLLPAELRDEYYRLREIRW